MNWGPVSEFFLIIPHKRASRISRKVFGLSYAFERLKLGSSCYSMMTLKNLEENIYPKSGLNLTFRLSPNVVIWAGVGLKCWG